MLGLCPLSPPSLECHNFGVIEFRLIRIYDINVGSSILIIGPVKSIAFGITCLNHHRLPQQLVGLFLHIL